jgi:hemoglobin/transferrin/lactoferrin receptor protein
MVTVIDQNTLQPIENVGVYIGNSESRIGMTNASGQMVLNKLSGSELLVFRNAMYTPVTITLDKLMESNFQLTMSENVNSINEIVVSASKFEEQRKDVAQKIQVIRSNELQNMNQTSTADVIANSGNVEAQSFEVLKRIKCSWLLMESE